MKLYQVCNVKASTTRMQIILTWWSHKEGKYIPWSRIWLYEAGRYVAFTRIIAARLVLLQSPVIGSDHSFYFNLTVFVISLVAVIYLFIYLFYLPDKINMEWVSWDWMLAISHGSLIWDTFRSSLINFLWYCLLIRRDKERSKGIRKARISWRVKNSVFHIVLYARFRLFWIWNKPQNSMYLHPRQNLQF